MFFLRLIDKGPIKQLTKKGQIHPAFPTARGCPDAPFFLPYRTLMDITMKKILFRISPETVIFIEADLLAALVGVP